MSTFDQRYYFNYTVSPSLTLEQAKTWQAEQDATCWIEYNVLDPHDLPRCDDMIARVESRFENLLNREIEDQIAAKLVDDCLFYGCTVAVHEGQDWALARSLERETILAAMRSTDADSLHIWDADGKKVGAVWLIYGNRCDLISDCTDNDATKALLAGAEALAESLQG